MCHDATTVCVCARRAPVRGVACGCAGRVVPERKRSYFIFNRCGWTFLLVGRGSRFYCVVLAPARRLWMRFNPTTKSSSNSV